MNDDQIRSELERRAGSGARPEWTSRQLLIAVREGIDSRPQRVTTTTLLSPRLGVAAVVAALVVLVVAVPRLTPQPPTSTGSPRTNPTAIPNSSLNTMSPMQFFEGWRSSDVRGRTVLVDGSIEQGVTVARGGPPCLPPKPCSWGSLTGIDPGLAIYARHFAVPSEAEGHELAGPTWPWWNQPQVPISGTLALSVQADGLVVFEGLVRPSTPGLEWALVDAAALDIATFRPEDVAIVRGKLETVFVDRDCPSTSVPGVAGLPSRPCESSSVLVSSERDDVGTLVIQPDALAQYGGSESLYAISPRLYGGYCDGPPPCWLWDVVARVDAAPMPEPTPAPTAAPTPSTLPITHTCAGDLSVGPIELADNAGLIESCSKETVDWPGEPIVVSDASRGVVRVVYSDGCAGASQARLDIWARSDLAWPTQPPYVLSVDLRAPSSPDGCRAEMVSVAVDITFMNAGLAPTSLAGELEAFVMSHGRAIDVFEDGDGEYRIALEIASDKSEYVDGEAVEVQSSLASETDLTLQCPFGPHIALEQLDGELSFAPGPFILMCSPARELRSGEKITSDFSAGPWGSTEPNPLAPYLREGKLYLPPGTYMFSSYSTFGLGDRPNTVRADLRTSIVVRVLPAVPEPKPSPSLRPQVGIECDGAGLPTTILDAGDLVVSCSHADAAEFADDGSGVMVVNEADDPLRVRILWRSSICTDATWLTYMGNPEHALFVVSPSTDCTDSAARIWAIEIVLSRPVEVSAGRFIRN